MSLSDPARRTAPAPRPSQVEEMRLAVHPLRGKPFRASPIAGIGGANDEDREEHATASGSVWALFRADLPVSAATWLAVGKRILLLNHIERVSGKQCQVILEVVEHDPTTEASWSPPDGDPPPPGTATFFTPRRSASRSEERTIPVTATRALRRKGPKSSPDTRARHRAAATYLLPRLMGFSVDGSEADFRAVGQRMPFVRLATRD